MQGQLIGKSQDRIEGEKMLDKALDAFAEMLKGKSDKELVQFLIDFCQRDEMLHSPVAKYNRADLRIVKAEVLRRMAHAAA